MQDPQNQGEPDSNHYAMPLDISPVIDVVTKKVTRIDRLPTGRDASPSKARPYQIRPPNEYLPKHQKLRTDLKPLHVVQPEGASFRVTRQGESGHIIEWQKWRFRVGFNQREGMVIYDVGDQRRYQSKCRGCRDSSGAHLDSLRRTFAVLSTLAVGYEHPVCRSTASVP